MERTECSPFEETSPTTKTLDIPVLTVEDRTIRLKVIDACGMACTFCHNEGTSVVARHSSRVSIYEDTNNIDFSPAPMQPNAHLRQALVRLKDGMQLNEIHLTGGEPTLHPRLAEIIALGKDLGFEVNMTSNGESPKRQFARYASAGLSKVTFSLFGTNPQALLTTQSPLWGSLDKAEAKLNAARSAIDAALQEGIKVSINVVVVDETHCERVLDLMQSLDPQASIKLLPSLAQGNRSLLAMDRVLHDAGARPVRHHITVGSSDQRTEYITAGGRVLFAKYCVRNRLPSICNGCRFDNDTDCQEGYYGLRLYLSQQGEFIVGVCIQRMDASMKLDQFLSSRLRDEVLELRKARSAAGIEHGHATRYAPTKPVSTAPAGS